MINFIDKMDRILIKKIVCNSWTVFYTGIYEIQQSYYTAENYTEVRQTLGSKMENVLLSEVFSSKTIFFFPSFLWQAGK